MSTTAHAMTAGELIKLPRGRVGVISRRNKAEQKTAHCLQRGALAVWLVDSQARTGLVDGQRKLLSVEDELSGGELIPVFRLAVSEIFTI